MPVGDGGLSGHLRPDPGLAGLDLVSRNDPDAARKLLSTVTVRRQPRRPCSPAKYCWTASNSHRGRRSAFCSNNCAKPRPWATFPPQKKRWPGSNASWNNRHKVTILPVPLRRVQDARKTRAVSGHTGAHHTASEPLTSPLPVHSDQSGPRQRRPAVNGQDFRPASARSSFHMPLYWGGAT